MCASASDIAEKIGDKGGINFPEPPDALKKGARNWKKLLAYFGPGAVLASMGLGSGELIFAPRGGAIFGFAILWALVWAGLVKGVMAYSGVRYYTLTGEHIMSRWAKMPGPRGWFTLLIGFLAIVALPAWIAGFAEILGNITAWMLGLPGTDTTFAAIGTVMMVVTAGLVLLGGYEAVEKIQIAIVAFLSAAIVVLAFAAAPSPIQVLGGLVPTIPSSYPAFVQQNYPLIAKRPVWVEIVTYMGAIGGGVQDYIGYVGYVKNREWGMLNRSDVEVQRFMETLDPGEVVPISTDEEAQRLGHAWLKAPQVDVLVSFSAITLFTVISMALGAVTLHEAELVPSGTNLLKYQAQWFTDIAPGLGMVWQVAAFAAIFGTLYSVWEGYTWAWLETFKPFSDRLHQLEQDNMTVLRLITIVYCGGIGLVLLWSSLSAVAIVTLASLLGGVFACGLWCWAMIWSEKTALPEVWQGGWKLDLALAISGTFLTGAGIIAILGYFGIIS